MWRKIQDTLRKLFKGVYRSAISRFPLTSADEQTRGSWAKRVDSYQSVPGGLPGVLPASPGKGESIPLRRADSFLRGISAPRDREAGVRPGGRNLGAGKKGKPARSDQLPPVRDQLPGRYAPSCWTPTSYHRRDRRSGVPASSTIRFNSVTDYLLAPIVERIRRTRSDVNGYNPGFGAREVRSLGEGELQVHELRQTQLAGWRESDPGHFPAGDPG